MVLLSVTFLYTGLQLSFWSAVYPTAVGFTNTFGPNRKALATLCSIFIAAGEVSKSYLADAERNNCICLRSRPGDRDVVH